MSNHKITRRNFLRAAGTTALSLPLFDRTRLATSAPPEQTLYVGTYTAGTKSEGVYVYRMNMSTGELTHFKTVKNVIEPSYLIVDQQRRFLFAVNEVLEFDGKPSGAVSAFRLDPVSGEPKYLNQKASRGGWPCYLTLDQTQKFVLVANYKAGNVSVLPVNNDGTLGEATATVQHEGSSINRERQEGPHAHCIVVDRSNRYAFAVDLGIDKIIGYRFDARKGSLSPHTVLDAKPGAGPRHLTFHPNNRHAYVINELDSTITAMSYDAARGSLRSLQTLSTLPPDHPGENYCADLHVSRSGRFLYGSNRGHDSIAVFEIDARSGQLKPVEHVSTGGKWPRNFAIDPTGTFLLAANQKSDSVVTFRIDTQTGRLKPTGHVTEIPAPSCLRLVT